jgi:hypothetical protein
VTGNADQNGGSLDFGDFYTPQNDASNHQVLGLVQLRYDF